MPNQNKKEKCCMGGCGNIYCNHCSPTPPEITLTSKPMSNPTHLKKLLEEFNNTMFPMDLVQSSLDIDSPNMDLMKENREKLKSFLAKVYREARKEGIEEVEELLPKPYNPSNAVMNREREAENSMLKKIKEAIKKRKENNEKI